MCCSDVLALPIFKQEEPQLSPESEARLPPLQYVLCAATSPAVKLHEETLTYLNQGSGWNAGAGAEPGGRRDLREGWGVGLNDPLPASLPCHSGVSREGGCRVRHMHFPAVGPP